MDGGGVCATSGRVASWADVQVQRKVLRPGQAPVWDVLFADRSTGSYGIKKLRKVQGSGFAAPSSGASGGSDGGSGGFG